MRKNQSTLSDDRWDNIIDAMKCLKKSKKNHNWDFFVDTHGKYASHQHDESPHIDGEDLHIHSPFYWLAWHRKFILEFEKELKADGMTGNLPYWNWTTTRKIPDELGQKVFGWMGVSRAISHNGDKLPTVSELNTITSSTSYAFFDSELNNLHGEIHNWVGGTMANASKSPKDPLFFLHHSFIDKLWAKWQADNPTANFSSELLEATLAPWNSVKVKDVMKISDLGYGYE